MYGLPGFRSAPVSPSQMDGEGSTPENTPDSCGLTPDAYADNSSLEDVAMKPEKSQTMLLKSVGSATAPRVVPLTKENLRFIQSAPGSPSGMSGLIASQ